MKNLFFLISACLTLVTSVRAQCDLDFSFKNTGTNMTAFFTPPASQAIYNDLGDGVIGAFFIDENGNYICAASDAFSSTPIQLAVMADDSTTPEKDGFASGDQIAWFYETADGTLYNLTLTPSETFSINGITYISSASIQTVNCGDLCPPLETEYVNTGANMTLFVTPDAASQLNVLGDGELAVYYDLDGALTCAGSAQFNGGQVQITAMADDATTPEKDGFADGDIIIWKFQDSSGNQYEINPIPYDNYALNGISFITSINFAPISCAVDVEGCTNEDYVEYNPLATIDDDSCLTLAISGCTNSDYLEYISTANVDDGSCTTFIVHGCTNSDYFEYISTANVDDGSCTTVIVHGCTSSNYLEYDINANVDDNSCATLVVLGCNNENAENFNPNANSNDGSCEYDLIPADCRISFETLNTGTNHTIMVPGTATDQLNLGDLIGVFYISDNGSTVCAGSEEWTGANMQIVAYGDDTTTPEVDGLSVGAPFIFLAQSGDDLFMVGASFESSGMASYAVNGLSFVSDLDFNHTCTVEYLGCTDENACNYDATVNTNDGSCEYPEDFYNCFGSCTSDVDSDGVCDQLEIEGCTDVNAANYDVNATDSGSCEYLGCTNDNYLEYDPEATIDDDSSCMTIIVTGCTDENATNFNTDANTNDGSCEYDLIPEDCQMSFETINTGTNHTIMIPGSSTSILSAGDLIGVFFISADGSAACAGSSEWTGNNMQIVAYGDDTTTPEVDGLSVGAPFIFLAQSGDDLFMVDASFESSGMASYAVNGLSFVSGLDFNHACTVEYLGCTDDNACNYDATVNTDDGSCEYPEDFYNCSGSCTSDVDADGICDEFEVGGCTDTSASNFDATATEEDGSCISWEEAYGNCLASGGDDGITQADVDAVQALLDAANADLATALANQGEDDGVTQADVDAVQALLNVANANLENALASQEDGVTQADVDAAVAAVDITTDNQAVADAAYADGAASVTPEDGVTQADVDAAVAAVDVTTDNQAVADAAFADGAASVTCEGNGNGNNNQDEVLGCTKRKAFNYDALATVNDGSCVMPKKGCTNPDAVNYNPKANTDNGKCRVKVAGCTNPKALNFDPSANKNDGSCIRAIAGCTDANAHNYNPNANSDNGSCIGAVYGCMFDFGFVTNFNPSANSNQISASDSANPCNYNFGSRTTSSRNRSLTQVCTDPLANNYFSSADSNSSSYDQNVASSVAVDNSVCEYSYGCTDPTAFNYDVTATVDDDSCVAEVVGCMDAGYVEYDANANVSNSNLCITIAVSGCTDVNASNYDLEATLQSVDQYGNSTCIYTLCEDIPDASGCIYSDAYAALRPDFTAENCTTYGGTPCEEVIVGCTDSDADNYNAGATDDDGSCLYAIAYADASEALIAALVNQEDGVSQADVDAVQALLDAANTDLATALANQGEDDGVTQADVDAVQALLNLANTNLENALLNQEDGVTQADLDAVQTLLDAANAEIENLNTQLENTSPNNAEGGSCAPIYVELLEGWNIIGYTLPYEQDVSATMSSIVSDVQIVKNNAAKVYWPEYGFNGIGNYIPGQGYQIRMSSSISSYTFPDVGGQRIELLPTVPSWVYDLPILNHPNDTRTLVKVVNMLGREVNPSDQFKGEVLLYLYSDGTTEKLLVK